MSPRKRSMGRHPHAMVVPTDQMVPADQDTQASLFAGPEAMADPSTDGQAPTPRSADDYWSRALGKSSVPPVAPAPGDVRRRAGISSPPPAEAEQPADDSPASYWDRARGVAPRRPLLPERPSAPPPAAAVSVAPAALRDAPLTTEDTVAASLALSEPAFLPTECRASGDVVTTVRGAHARKEDPLAAEVRGAHVRADDPIAGVAWEAQLNKDDSLADAVSGAHVKADDPLAATLNPAHAPKTSDSVEPSESEVAESAAEAVRAKTRRRWGVVPVASAAAALAAGLGGGAAYAYFTSHGSGIGSATTGSAQSITVTAVASPGADSSLYPGGPGVAVHFTVNNPNPYAVTFTGWSGAVLSTVTPIGGNTCTTGDFQIANPSGSFGSSLMIPANTPSSPGVSGAANGVVQLKTTAQNGCQGATVTVTLTLTGGQQT